MECDEVSFFQKQSDAALLLLMLEAVPTDLVFTISLKRSTPNLQLSTSCPADYPISSSDYATELLHYGKRRRGPITGVML